MEVVGEKTRGRAKKRYHVWEEEWKALKLVKKMGMSSVKGLLNRAKAFVLFPARHDE